MTNIPIAIVGIGCRFPGGADGPDAFFRLLCEGVDAIGEAPARLDLAGFYDPRPGTPGKVVTRMGGFLEGVEDFDNGFFGVSPREAARMDPQQRLLMEVSWEALEDAGIPKESLVGSRTGVFVGVCFDDYGNMIWDDPASVDIYVVTGAARNGIPGRVSYAFDLRGPSMAVDTACSSSLVSIHLACQSLRTGESTLALAAGVNLLLRPAVSFGFSAAKMLAPDGRCKAFDARGDGFVRSEGVGALVLKPLAAALADGDPIHAIIRGSATNNDGRSSGFIMTPGDEGQAMVFRDACRDAGVRPQELSYIEAHGTGTRAGDPVELRGLAKVLDEPAPPDQKVLVGSVKTNIGHTEGAAGIAGVIKAAVALRERFVPGNLHFETPNPAIPWADLPLAVAAAGTPLQPRASGLFAGVSSFGISGSNAHVILEAADGANSRQPAPLPAVSAGLVTLSASSPEALVEVARRTRAWLDTHALSFADLSYTTNVRRSHHESRLALVAADTTTLKAGLDDWLAGVPHVGAPRESGGVVFVFPGQGGQWAGMGRSLLADEPVFRARLEEVDAALRPVVGWSVIDELRAGEGSRVAGDDTSVIQPAIFAIQVALAALWMSWGIVPDAVVGHSLGEVAAACVAGRLSLTDAAHVIAVRSQIVRAQAPRGGMAAVELPEDELRRALAEARGVEIAAHNGATTWLIAGDRDAVDEVVSRLAARDRFARRVQVDYASHCAHMDALLPELRERLAGIVPLGPGPLAFVSTVHAGSQADLDAQYWCDNLRRPVGFYPTVARLVDEGCRTFVEMSPHPVLTDSTRRTLAEKGASGVAVGSLRRPDATPIPDRAHLLTSLAALYEAGSSVAWPALHPRPGPCVSLPLYPWQRQRLWIEDVRRGGSRPLARGAHPLLGAAHPSSIATRTWDTQLGTMDPSWLEDHRVGGAPLLPATGFIEMMLAAASAAGCCAASPSLVDLRFVKALALLPAPRAVQVVLEPELGGARVRVMAREDDETWSLSAAARVADGPRPDTTPLDLEACKARCSERWDAGSLYAAMALRGLDYGPSFQGVSALFRREGEALGAVHLPPALAWDQEPFVVHPALLDACFQVCLAAMPSGERTFVPVAAARVWLGGGEVVWSRAVVRLEGHSDALADVTLHDAEGRVTGEITGLRVHAITTSVDGWLHHVHWRSVEVPRAPVSGSLVLVTGPDGRSKAMAAALSAELEAAGGRVRTVGPGASLSDAGELAGVVYLAALDASVTDLEAAVNVTCHELLASLRDLTARRPAPRLWIVTEGATGPEPHEPAGALAVGLGRVIAQEQPALRCTLVDLESDTAASRLAAALAIDDEDELAFHGGELLAPRLRPAAVADLRERPELLQERTSPAGERNFRLEVVQVGSIDALTMRAAAEPPPPGPGEVALEVEVVALNFSDVLFTLGAYPGMDPSAVGLGRECAAVVRAVGEGVTRVAPGDLVIAVTPFRIACFTRRIVIPQGLVWRRPAGLSPADAAAIPAVWLTVWYGLHTLARLQAGERVLIHYATGGVGQAALQLARSVGAEIFATAGSEEKRAWLRAQGVRWVFDSRSLAFADEVLAATDGEGVDVVLNAIPGEGVARGLAALRRGGRFIELGKAGVQGDDTIGLGALRQNLTFTVLDIEAYIDAHPDRVQEILLPVLAGFERGTWKPTPVEVFPASRVATAFERLARAHHLGKLAVDLRDPELRIAPAARRPPGPGGAWLVTGGLGGLGLAVAGWLARSGVRDIALVGRGAPGEAARAAIDALTAEGVQVRVLAADVSQRADVRRVLSAFDGVPLRGVIHAAGSLDDATLLSLDETRVRRVLAPKVWGAWHLHEETRALELDAFVLFSSAASLLGSPGQGNYAAGNAFMDALAHRRRREGLPALSINWGPWSDVGLAARPDRGGRIAQRGLDSVSPEQGIEALAQLLPVDVAQVAAMRFNAALWKSFNLGTRSLLKDSAAEAQADLLDRVALARAPRPARVEAVTRLLGELAGRVTGVPTSRIDPARPLARLGLDSLMAVELRNRIEARLGVAVPVVRILQGPSIAELSGWIADQMTSSEPTLIASQRAEAILASVDQLSDDAVDDLLEQMLAAEEGDQ